MTSEETNQSPEIIAGKAATLEVNGVAVAHGRVSFYPNPDRGKFWRSGEDDCQWNFLIAGRRKPR